MKTQSSFIHSSKGKTDIIISLVFLLLVLNVGESVGSVFAMQDNKKKSSPKTERSKGSEIEVRHADIVSYDEQTMPGVQIFVGNVEFYHEGTVLKCDSANFYQSSNSFAAFSNVNMFQGDTISLKCNYLFYDGYSQIAQAREKVVLKHRNSTLYTDSLDYDRLYSMGYFFEGGKLVDADNVLTSDWGQYDAQTREAVFNYNVELKSRNYEMQTDTLYYNVITKDATTTGRSNVVSGTTNIYTEKGHFNTNSNCAILLNRSIVKDGDSKMVADSIIYDKDTKTAEGFGDFIYNDDKNKTILTGDYCYFNDSTNYCIAYGNALVKNFSEPDTLFLHADTLKMLTYNVKTDSVYRVVHGYFHSRSYRTDVQSVADSLVYNSRNNILSLYGNPIVWNNRQQIVGEEIHSFFNDSTIDSIRVINQALLCEKLDSVHYNQVASKDMYMYFNEGSLNECHAVQNVKINYFQLDDNLPDTVVIAMNHTETSLMKMYMKNKKVSKVWTAEADGTFYPILFVNDKIMYLENFAWFDDIRPKNKHDVFRWQDKPAEKILKKTKRREVPYQYLKKSQSQD